MFQRMRTALGGADQNLQSMCRFHTKKLLGKLGHNLDRAFVNAESIFLYVLCNLCVLHDWYLALARARCVRSLHQLLPPLLCL